MTVDDLIEKYGTELQDIYEQKTAGAFTFVGVLSTFLREVDRARDGVEKAPESPVEPSHERVEYTWRVTSDRSPMVRYTVMRSAGTREGDEWWTCTCSDFKFKGGLDPDSNYHCKHIQRVVAGNGPVAVTSIAYVN